MITRQKAGRTGRLRNLIESSLNNLVCVSPSTGDNELWLYDIRQRVFLTFFISWHSNKVQKYQGIRWTKIDAISGILNINIQVLHGIQPKILWTLFFILKKINQDHLHKQKYYGATLTYQYNLIILANRKHADKLLKSFCLLNWSWPGKRAEKRTYSHVSLWANHLLHANVCNSVCCTTQLQWSYPRLGIHVPTGANFTAGKL